MKKKTANQKITAKKKKTPKKNFIEVSDQESPELRPDTGLNWSQPEDRSEDLINETDPYIQEPEKDPHESLASASRRYYKKSQDSLPAFTLRQEIRREINKNKEKL